MEIALPRSGWARVIRIGGASSKWFWVEAKTAAIHGLIISDGCNLKKPEPIHLLEPRVLEPKKIVNRSRKQLIDKITKRLYLTCFRFKLVNMVNKKAPAIQEKTCLGRELGASDDVTRILKKKRQIRLMTIVV